MLDEKVRLYCLISTERFGTLFYSLTYSEERIHRQLDVVQAGLKPNVVSN